MRVLSCCDKRELSYSHIKSVGLFANSHSHCTPLKFIINLFFKSGVTPTLTPPAVRPQIPAGTTPKRHRRHRKQQKRVHGFYFVLHAHHSALFSMKQILPYIPLQLQIASQTPVHPVAPWAWARLCFICPLILFNPWPGRFHMIPLSSLTKGENNLCLL